MQADDGNFSGDVGGENISARATVGLGDVQFRWIVGDPSVLGLAAPPGSVALRVDAPFGIYSKTDVADTAWTLVAGGGTAGAGWTFDGTTVAVDPTAVLVQAGPLLVNIAANHIESDGAYPTGGFSAASSTLALDVYMGGTIIQQGIATITPPAGASNDVVLGAQPYQFARVRVDTTAGAATFTGIDADGASWPYNGGNVAGVQLDVFNLGPNTLTLANANAGSLAINRFSLPAGVDLVLAANEGRRLVYDGAGPGQRQWTILGPT